MKVAAGFVGVAAAIGATLALAVLPVIVLAHASLVTADPAAGATITTPYTLVDTFAEQADPTRSTLTVENASGTVVATGTVDATDQTKITAALPALPSGTYTVRWTTVTSDDNGVERGTYTFNVGGSSATPAPTPSPSGGASDSGNNVLIAIGIAAVLIVVVVAVVILRGPALSTLDELGDPRGIVFDLDGTLVNTVETRIEAWLQVFAEVRIKAERDHVARLIGSDGKRLAHEVADIAGHPINDDKAEAIDKRCGEIYDKLNTDPKPTNGAHDLLAALSASSLSWAIATSSRREQTVVSVKALGLDHEPRIVDGSHVLHAKPAPDLLLLAAEQLDLPASACWYVGDSTWDVQAATAARMTAVAVPYGAVSGSTLTRAGANVVTTLPDLQADLQRRGLLS